MDVFTVTLTRDDLIDRFKLSLLFKFLESPRLYIRENKWV